MKRLLASTAAIHLPLVFMSDAVPTVTVMMDHGPVQINRDDYNEERHGAIFAGDHEYNADGTRRDANPITPSAPGFTRGDEKIAASDDGGKVELGNLGVRPGKKKGKDTFTVIDTNTGQPVAMEGIDAKGYASNADAWKAITDAQAAAQTRDEQNGDQPHGDAMTAGM